MVAWYRQPSGQRCPAALAWLPTAVRVPVLLVTIERSDEPYPLLSGCHGPVAAHAGLPGRLGCCCCPLHCAVYTPVVGVAT